MTPKYAKTKIITTIGPATQSIEMLSKLYKAGMDVVRLNFSHGSYDQHKETIDCIKKTSELIGEPIPILMDLCGPKLRIGNVEDNIVLKEGDKISLITEEVIGNKNRISTNYYKLLEDIKPEDFILIDDGLLKLKVLDVNTKEAKCEVVYGGPLKSKKGINLPGVKMSIPSITEKDKKDLEFGLSQGADFVALSFVRNHEDIVELRSCMKKLGYNKPIVAKIEKPEAIKDLNAIILETDMVMVARGDLGVELNTEEVPLLQKLIIEKCNYYGRPVITATQMLESMINNPRPTRAEASDVANAVLDGTDAVMLSAETSVGLYPIQTVTMMDNIVRRIEEKRKPIKDFSFSLKDDNYNLIDAMSRSACGLANDTKAAAIFVVTRTGRTARYLSRYRPNTPIIAFTDNIDVVKQLNIVWGVKAEKISKFSDTDTTFNEIKEHAHHCGLVRKGNLVVFVAGIPILESQSINMIKTDTI
jgi:pyruvate kinase